MNRDLENLFIQSDKQLLELETEECEKQRAKTIDEDVDQKDLPRFNQPSVDQSSYAARHPFQLCFSLLLVPLVAVQIYWMFAAPRTIGPYHLIIGTVRSSSVIGSGHLHYGTVVASKIVLPDGRVISLPADSGKFLPTGTPVSIRVYDSGAVVADRSF